MRLARLMIVCSAVAVPAAMAQSWEMGAGAGGGFYTSQDVTLGANSAEAKVKTGAAVSVWLTNNTSGHWGGELRYSYQMGDLQLKRNSTEASFGAESHSINYNFLYYTRSTESAIRPFFSAGAGVKMYRGTGTESPIQPLSQYALLSKVNDLKPVVSLGVGVKVKLSQHMQVRFDVHDYLTPFPEQAIAPNFGATAGGWFNDIVPMVGLAYTN